MSTSAPTILYGITGNTIDVTDVAIANCVTDNTLLIPSGDHERAAIFTDPIYGILKSIFINTTEYTSDVEINITDFIPAQTKTSSK